MRRIALAAVAALALAGCHTVRYDTGQAPGHRVVKVPVNYFAWGLVGKHVIDLDDACPEGVARWENGAALADLFVDLATFGIWSPRTVTIECAEGRGR